MNLKKAWTMAEMMVAFIIIIIVSVIGMTTIKPNQNKAKIYVYATIKNFGRANAYLIEKYGELVSDDMTVGANLDPYCIYVADVFSIEGKPNCSTLAADKDAVNITMANGVTVQGLASSWISPFDKADFYFKNIVIDIDGQKGANKLGVDRFPLRIFKEGNYEGIVLGVDCNKETFYDPDDQTKTYDLYNGTKKHPYCYDGFTPAGTRKTNNFLTDGTIFSYDIFVPIEEGEEESRTKVVGTSLSTMQADCMAYGGMGFFSKKQCSDNGFRLHSSCVTSETCEACKGSNYDVCPKKSPNDTVTVDIAGCETMQKDNNPNDFGCVTFITKPTAGLGMLAGALMGEIDM